MEVVPHLTRLKAESRCQIKNTVIKIEIWAKHNVTKKAIIYFSLDLFMGAG